MFNGLAPIAPICLAASGAFPVALVLVWLAMRWERQRERPKRKAKE